MFCSKCGKENSSGAGFCGSCGAPLNGTPHQVAPQQKLDVQSFLAADQSYQKKKRSVNTIGAIMCICMLIGGILVLYGLFFAFSVGLTILGSVILFGSFFVLVIIMIAKAISLEKYGNQLYAEYLKK